jgi:hypothetical protein
MADNYVAVPPDSTAPGARKIDTTEITRADGAIVERQRIIIGDDDAALQKQIGLLQEILMELQQIKMHLL